MTSNKMTTAQVSNPHDVATGINQVWDDEVELDRFFRQFSEAGGDSHVWRRAEQIARDERVATFPNYPPDLIDLDTGDIWEWEQFPAGGGDAGYARDDDHDWAWPRAELETQYRLVELRTLDQVELDRLGEIWANQDDECE
jgi:hypothetical protein